MHPALQFTMEEENSKALAFLDVLVEREERAFITSIYRKPTFTGQYVPWNSFCPVQRKTNIIDCLARRARMICSPQKLDEEIKIITSMFIDLGYPDHIIRRSIDRQMKTSLLPTFGPNKCPAYLRLPYIGPISSRFEKSLKRAVGNTYSTVNLRVIFQTRTPLNGCAKDPSPIQEKNNVIYHYKCHCDSAYIGRTTQRFHRRRDQHVPPRLRTWMTGDMKVPPNVAKSSLTAIGQHLVNNVECARNYNDDRFTFISRGRNLYHLSILESIYITTKSPILCRQKEFVYKLVLCKMLTWPLPRMTLSTYSVFLASLHRAVSALQSFPTLLFSLSSFSVPTDIRVAFKSKEDQLRSP